MEGVSVKHKFQVHLSGIIDLLSNHLYSGPHVFIRELLQNSVDAITARRNLEPEHLGEIVIQTVEGVNGCGTLAVIDNGIGLTEEEIHSFLATIAQTGKVKEQLSDGSLDFIGQFGIGLLSCFVVSEEIVVISKSLHADSPAVEWRGFTDGTYSIKTLEKDIAPGTQVYLTAKESAGEFFTTSRVTELCKYFGSLLPYQVKVVSGEQAFYVNENQLPWSRRFSSEKQKLDYLLNYGRETFDMEFLDCIPLKSTVGDVEGLAFVLPRAPSLTAKRTNKVYLKRMLLSEQSEGLLPEWAFFVKCIVNANKLRPTASRESFYEDEALQSTREELGDCLKGYLLDLAKTNPNRLEQLISVHFLAIKALSLQDEELYTTFINFLPFNTSLGTMTLQEYKERSSVFRYVDNVDSFRQVTRVAAAQGICLINGGYTYDAELLSRLPLVFPDVEVELVDPNSLVQDLEDLDLDERELSFNLIKVADLVLQQFKCSCEIKKFLPPDVPVLYSSSPQAAFGRSIEQAKEVSAPLWSSLLDGLAGQVGCQAYSQLCFNFNNPLVIKLCSITDRNLLENVIQMLYVQALLLGHHPLNAKEQSLLNEGMISLISLVVNLQTEAKQ